MVLVCGAIVVPGIVLAGSVVNIELTVLPAETIILVLGTETTLGLTVVPGIVVVYVFSCPSAVTGMALPLPDAVYWVGIARVAVSGLASDEAEPYIFPDGPPRMVKLPVTRFAVDPSGEV